MPKQFGGVGLLVEVVTKEGQILERGRARGGDLER